VTKWTLDDALVLVRGIQPQLHARRWHVALGGGVLNKGTSEKDLDLYFLPFDDGQESTVLLPHLETWWGKSTPLSDGEYMPSPMFPEKVKFATDSKRIDAFIGACGSKVTT
jgi:hypothetical protein